MARVFAQIGRFVVRRRWAVLAAWVVLLAAGIVFAPRLQQVFEREFVTGNTGDSQAAADVISSEFTSRSAYQQQLVLRSRSFGVSDPRYRAAAERVIAAAMSGGLVTSTEGYFSTGQRAFVSGDGRTTYVLLNLRSRNHSDGMNASGKVIDRVAAAPKPQWLDAYVTGEEALHADITDESRSSLQQAEAVGLPIALLVLVFVFGALIAAALPLIVGLVAIVIALALAFAVGQFLDLSIFVESFATMLGLGVGIDYALFLLTRYRAERREGRPADAAVAETVTHAGRAIAFSGAAVVIGLGALLATGDPTVGSMGIGGILVVLAAVAAALTLLPATISVLGPWVEQPRSISRLIGRIQPRRFWQAWARRVLRRPLPVVLAAVVVLAALAWPTLDLRTGTLGAKILDRNAQSRQGYEALAQEFGPGVISPVEIVVRASGGVNRPRTLAGIDRLTRAIQADPRFAGAIGITSLAPGLDLRRYQALYTDDFSGLPASLAGPVRQLVNVGRGGDVTVVRAFLGENPGSRGSKQAVRALRNEVIPSIPELRADEVLVGGPTALELDITDTLYSRFPLVIGLILGASFLLLLVLLRSLIVPLLAVATNLLATLASFGLLVLVFQEGWGERLLGFDSIGSVNWVTPVLLFGVLFGLSMDYQVFLLSRLRELRDRGHGKESVALALERSGGVIGGAAAIMIVVFAAFTISPIVPLKELGFGLAAAVFLAATAIQLLLVPAALRLLGERAWWLPRFLERAASRLAVETPADAPAAGEAQRRTMVVKGG